MGETEDGRGHNTDASRYFAAREFKTNIEPLDKLLGYSPDLHGGTGIRPGDIIVLRGGPGSGKTTLGLQIISKFLESDDCLYTQDLAAIFLSLEVDPARAIEKVTRDFHFFKERMDCLVPVPAVVVEDAFRKSLSQSNVADRRKNIVTGVTKCIFNIIARPTKPFADAVADIIADWILSLTQRLRQQSDVREQQDKSGPGVIRGGSSRSERSVEGILFIDSVNALLAMLHQCLRMKEWEPRLALKNAVDLLRQKFGNFVIVISSEFHHEPSWVASGMSESFLSDVEILLTSEPITVPPDYAADRPGAVGYSILKIIDKMAGKEGTKLESRSFIRVLKSRKGANQSRRCAYDIASGVGVQFYETYPGDGHILLFTENPQQKRVWDTFFKEDLPQTYPALRYEDFDRSSLQRTFLSQRRFLHVPRRTDMYVSSFDNYWINWYGELCWRRAIVDALRERIVFTPGNQANLSKLASAIHKSLMRQGLPLLKGMRDRVRANGIAPGDVLTALGAVLRNEHCIKCFLCRSCWWLLKKIAAESECECKDAFSRMSDEGTRAESTTRAGGTGRVLHMYASASQGTRDIMEIFARMRDYTKACCDSSPVRSFCEKFGKASKGVTVASIMAQLEESGPWEAVGRASMPQGTVRQISRVLRTNGENRASRLSDEVDRLRPWIRSSAARERLAKVLRSLSVHVKGDELEAQVGQCLGEHLDRSGGCECEAEFSKRLRDTLPRKRVILRKHTDDVLGRLFDGVPSLLLGDVRGTRGNPASVMKTWMRCTGDRAHAARYNLLMTYHLILEKRNAYRFLSVMPDDRLRLFGERRSPIIKELDNSSPDNRRPIHRPGLLFSLRDTRSLVSIPYNANISFMVYRHDLLATFLESRLSRNVKDAFLDAYVKIVRSLYEEQRGLLRLFQVRLPGFEEKKVRGLLDENIREYMARSRSSLGPLRTWEELIALLRLMNRQNVRPRGRGPSTNLHFVIETQTFDTLLCTILELLWNCGGNLRIGPDYNVENERDTKARLSQALYLLGIMLRDGIITEDSTLDASDFGERYGAAGRAKAKANPRTPDKSEDWVFARQWYSTLVELLTARHELTRQPGLSATETHEPPFLWEDKEAQLGIMPIPISLSYYLARGARAHHVSCWGDWHWIMTKGTENMALGIDLINNLMSSQKVCERAFQCAAIPTVDTFYRLYKDSRCLNLPERRYHSPHMLPDTTFVGLRETYFKHARSRSEIFDYEHCMLELHSLFQFVKVLAREPHPDWGKLKRRTNEAFGRIKKLGEKTLLVH